MPRKVERIFTYMIVVMVFLSLIKMDLLSAVVINLVFITIIVFFKVVLKHIGG